MFYTVYKTTHLESGKTYIGMHKTAKADDSYLGSGKLISRAIKKYGRDAFTKEVLFVFDNPEAMIAKEKELVDEAFVARDDTYNLNVGGDGGWFRANQLLTTEDRYRVSTAGHARQQVLLTTDSEFRARRRAHCLRMATSGFDGIRPHCDWTGRKHKPESVAKQKATMAERGTNKGASNSQFGTIWVVKSGTKAKKIGGAELATALEEGWVRGRSLR